MFEQKTSNEVIASLNSDAEKGLSSIEAKARLEEAGLKCNINGKVEDTSTIKDQIPKPNIEVIANSSIILYTEEDAEKAMVTVPDVFGKSVSEATNLLKNVSLNIGNCK